MITADLLQQATSCEASLANLYAPTIDSAMAQFSINTLYRAAAFLAQTGHESQGFYYTAELWGPTPAQTAYEGNKTLGNTQPGDGYLFRGRGFIQLTGRYNYTLIGQDLCLDCTNSPDMIATPEYAPLSSAWFWDKHNLNTLADQQLFSAITGIINGGQNGAADRLARYHRAIAALAEVFA